MYFAIALTTSLSAYNNDDLIRLTQTNNCVGCDLSFANLSNTDLTGANLSGSNLTGTDFTSTNLTNVNFTGTKIEGVKFKNTNLTGAFFGSSNIDGYTNDLQFKNIQSTDIISNHNYLGYTYNSGRLIKVDHDNLYSKVEVLNIYYMHDGYYVRWNKNLNKPYSLNHQKNKNYDDSLEMIERR